MRAWVAALALALWAATQVAAPVHSRGATPVPILRTRAGEFQPVRGDRHLAWERNTQARPSHYDVYASALGGKAFRVNPAGTSAANGGISRDRLVFQQFAGARSDIRFLDLVTRRRSSAPRAVNTGRWEYWPSISGNRLLFGRLQPKSGRRTVVLFDLEAGVGRTLASSTSRRTFLAPGQVSGNYSVWSNCKASGCEVFRYNAKTRATLKVPNPGSSQHAPSVTPSGTVYFARSRSSRCGSGVSLMRYTGGRRSSTVARLPEGLAIGDTYAYSDAFGNAQVLYDRYRCGRRTASDIYALRFTRAVTLTTSVDGDGRVTSTPEGIECPGVCRKQFRAGTRVTLSAQPAGPQTRFIGWTGACTGNGPCTVTMDASKTVTAAFETSYELSVIKSGSGGGAVHSDPAGIDCGNQCSSSFAAGAQVTLRAGADQDSVFAGWGGDCTGTSPTCSVSMDAAKNVVARFDVKPTYQLDVAIGSGSGTVTSKPDGINCPGDCSQSYAEGTEVTLRAAPGDLHTFARWEGACSGTDPTCSVSVNGAKSVTAHFEPVTPAPGP